MSSSSFRTIDAFDYEQIALIDARHKICDIAVDSIDHKVAVVEVSEKIHEIFMFVAEWHPYFSRPLKRSCSCENEYTISMLSNGQMFCIVSHNS